MSESAEIIAVQDGLAMRLTPEMVRQLNGRPGGRVPVNMTPNGLEVGKSSADFDAKTAVAERVMREDHAVLSKLAE